MNLFIVLVLSIISILFLLVGTLIVFSTHNSKKVMIFSVSLGFVVLLLLGIIHLIPDAYEFFREKLSVIIEGMTLYSSVLLNYETAVILTLGIGLHNIPLGFTLSSTFNKVFSKSKTILYIILIGFSYLFGALLAYKFNDVLMNTVVLGIALSFTFGMVLYIAIFEFLPLIRESKEYKVRNMGFILGFILMFLTLFL